MRAEAAHVAADGAAKPEEEFKGAGLGRRVVLPETLLETD